MNEAEELDKLKAESFRQWALLQEMYAMLNNSQVRRYIYKMGEQAIYDRVMNEYNALRTES